MTEKSTQTTDKVGRVLVVDDDEDVLHAARLLLKQHFAAVHTETQPDRLPSLLENEGYDVILLDMNFARDVSGGDEGFYWLKQIQATDPSAVVVLITAFGDVDLAVRAIKAGATDFVLKPWQNEKLVATLTAAMRLHRSHERNRVLAEQQEHLVKSLDHPYSEFIGVSAAMRHVFDTIQRVGPTEANVLILGENGTGKELVARALHRHSRRASRIFVGVDMGAVSDTLFESEFFGHVKGAFTDAREDRAGRFELASGGTLFLDEIGNLPSRIQAKLLTVLQERTVTRLGSNRTIPVDIRLISATNMPIHEMVQQQKFRQDLLYRINTIQITLPPLRERTDDIAPLAEHFLKIYCARYHKPQKRLAAGGLRHLEKYAWPGNVRELQHAIERAVIMSDRKTLSPADFPLYDPTGKDTKLAFKELHLEEVERTVIRRVLAKHNGNLSRACKELGLSRTSLYRRIQKYGL
jgi:DNA-binding NtrC family response regulator